MLEEIIRQTALDQLVAAVRHPDPRIRQLSAEMFWDLQYLYKFGIPKIPRPELIIPFPPQPQPDPSPIDRLRLHEEVLIGLVGFLSGDPEPQPMSGDPDPEPNIKAVLSNHEIRLSAAKNLRQKLEMAIQGLDKEISRLA